MTRTAGAMGMEPPVQLTPWRLTNAMDEFARDASIVTLSHFLSLSLSHTHIDSGLHNTTGNVPVLSCQFPDSREARLEHRRDSCLMCAGGPELRRWLQRSSPAELVICRLPRLTAALWESLWVEEWNGTSDERNNSTLKIGCSEWAPQYVRSTRTLAIDTLDVMSYLIQFIILQSTQTLSKIYSGGHTIGKHTLLLVNDR